jgi:glycine cleavage system H protein
VVYVQLPEAGAVVAAGDAFGEVESTKSVSEIYAPVAGTVVEVNTALDDAPETVNSAPYGDGWIVVIQVSDTGALDGLLDAAAYSALTEG